MIVTDTAPDVDAQPSSVETPDQRRVFLKQMLTAVGMVIPLSALGALGASPAARASDCDPNTQSCPPPGGKNALRTGAVISADGDRIRSMMIELEARRIAGKLQVPGLPMVEVYQSKGGRDPHTIEVLRGIEANVSRVSFSQLKSEAEAKAIVGKAIATYARQDPKRVAPCGTEFSNDRSPCRVLYQTGGSDLKQTLTQAGYRFSGYNIP
jgi:hypothetical protein